MWLVFILHRSVQWAWGSDLTFLGLTSHVCRRVVVPPARGCTVPARGKLAGNESCVLNYFYSTYKQRRL